MLKNKNLEWAWHVTGVHYEQLHANKFDNLDVTHQLLESQSAKLTEEKTDYMNRPVYIKEIQSITIPFQNRKHLAQIDPLVNSTKHLKKKL